MVGPPSGESNFDFPEANMPSPDSNSSQNKSALGCLIRFYWMGLGNIVLFFSAIKIAQRRDVFLSELDAVFWSAVFSLVMFRYIDIRHLNGGTTTGEPATISTFKKYAMGLAGAAAATWAMAHGVAYLIGGSLEIK
jgi:hypothetical protein